MTVQGAPGASAYTAQWKLMQASLRGNATTLQRVSLVTDGARIARTTGSAQEEAFASEHLEIHVRPRNPEQAERAVLDIALQMQGAVMPLNSATTKPFDADATASLGGIDTSGSKALPIRLREWQAAGGKLEVTSARMQQTDTIILGSGILGLSPAGKLDGTIELRLTGLRPVAALLFGEENASRVEAGLQAGLMLLGGRTEIEGKRGYTLPLRFSDGTVFLGPVRAGQIPSFY
jgi:hypothetical protein